MPERGCSYRTATIPSIPCIKQSLFELICIRGVYYDGFHFPCFSIILQFYWVIFISFIYIIGASSSSIGKFFCITPSVSLKCRNNRFCVSIFMNIRANIFGELLKVPFPLALATLKSWSFALTLFMLSLTASSLSFISS